MTVVTVQVPVALGGTNTVYRSDSGAHGMAASNGFGYSTELMTMLAEAMAACSTAVQYATNVPVTTGDRNISGNLSLGGIVSSAWYSQDKAIELAATGNGLSSSAGTSLLNLGTNVYEAVTGYKYARNAAITLYQQQNGTHYWFMAPSGVAGDPVTFVQQMNLAAAAGNVTTANAAACSLMLGKDAGTSRSLNAGGTINASGADYAEYMRKAAGWGAHEFAKGDIVGINAQGALTPSWSEAVAFLVKSTDPSYVGGDVWGNEDQLGVARPGEPQFREPERDAADDDVAHAGKVADAREAFEAGPLAVYGVEIASFEAALEAARQMVDRIAFSGQVPVNVLGATAGQWIVPAQDGDGFKGVAVDDAAITFEQYRRAVGKVIAIESDGRARLIVKVA